ncbi:insulin-like growth factor-binding protein complex acid labile subunit [Haliotis rubra]|uniref:insulin-like growth factor-binding protein complex acid labile subunit n=1 Tax=Haliotis rubra TaxID=36100 RepID=UPI001EE60E3C|nr:insulin-like growth factor-binding protein complex acid labile subunit [Haliotis rubra]
MEALIGILMMVAVRISIVNAHICTFRDQHDGLFVDCRGRQLQHVPDDLPMNMTFLDISENRITAVRNRTFQHFSCLKYINLNNNSLTTMEPDAFVGVLSLTKLLLASNKLSHQSDSLPEGLFRDLGNLHTLNLQNNKMYEYPDLVLAPLTELHNLYIDPVPDAVFGPEFSKLTNLKVLNMDNGHCSLETLKNETFRGLNGTKLEVLLLNHCHHLTSCQAGVLEPLSHLRHLELTNNGIGIHKVLRLLYPFVGRSMTRIWLNNTFKRQGVHVKEDLEDRMITEYSTRFLAQICVSELSLKGNRISLIEAGSINKSPIRECMEVVILSQNCIIGDGRLVFLAALFSKLRHLDVSHQHHVADETVNIWGQSEGIKKANITLMLPPNLQYYDATDTFMSTNTYDEVTFRNTENLHTVRFGYNQQHNIVRVKGLENVSHVDLSGNKLGSVSDDFFKSFSNVKSLSLKDCNLQFANDVLKARNMFGALKLMEYLDLSLNNLQLFPFILNQNRIIHLILSQNKFDTIPIVTENFPSLILLNMSFNMIGHLDRFTRSDLDTSAARNSLKVAFDGNIFSCGCDTLDFILWLMDTPVVYESDRNFACIQDNGQMTGTAEVAVEYMRIYRYCTGKWILTLTFTCLVVFLTSTITIYLISKNPTRCRNILMMTLGFGGKYLTQKDFSFKLYIGYCEADIAFVYRRLRPALELCKHPVRLFLKDREVLPGHDIADGIIEGVHKSWKTVLLVSSDFLEDDSAWSHFTTKAAIYSANALIQNRILILLMGEVQVQDLPLCLLNVVEEEFIIHVDDYPEAELWKHLRQTANLEH